MSSKKLRCELQFKLDSTKRLWRALTATRQRREAVEDRLAMIEIQATIGK